MRTFLCYKMENLIKSQIK